MQSKEKEQDLVDEQNQDNQEEKDSCLLKKVDNKTYLNLYCCQINIGLVFTYIYIFVSASLNVINRILFQNYNFHFNFTLSLAQQFTSLFLYLILILNYLAEIHYFFYLMIYLKSEYH